MELSKISRILVNIKERSRNNVTATQTKHYPCHLKNVNVDALELLEVMFKNESNMGVGNDGKQVYIHYSSLFKDQANTVHATQMRKTILIQGEPAVGKTMLCMSIVEEWASGKQFQEFQVVLLVPLMSRDVASATSLSELLHVLYTDFNADTCNQVATYLRSGESKILIIADGWEDLQASQCKIGSFLHSLLFSSDIIPTTSITVLITSRPGCIQLNIVKLIERFITLTGFEKNAIEYIIQSEFEGDFKRIHYLTAQLNDNPLIESICSTPLILAIVCDLCRSNNAEPLPNTMTELYAKLTWTLIIASTKCNLRDPYINVLSSHRDLPEELQQSWWAVCELAFRNIEKGHNHTLLQSDTVALSSLKLKISSYFGLIKPIPESEDASSISFLHPHFEEYLAALHLGKQPQKAQLKFMHELALNIGCKGRIAITFWHFFISFYVREVVNVNPDIITLALKALSIACCSNKQKYCIELCHFSFEAKNHIVNHQIVKAMSIASNKLLKFGNPRNIHDFSAMIYVIRNIMQICNVEINFQGCQLKSEHINGLAKALWEKSSIVQVKGLNLSNIKLNHSIAVDFFSKAATTLKFLRILILSNCQIGTIIDVKAILSALKKSSCQTLSHLDLSFNHISIPFLETLQQHIEFHATFESLQDFSLKGSLESDVSVSFLVNFSETLSSKCKCLRRLDLSDNNLGKPGNSDLRKIISLLLCLGRAFNLCLSKEYTSDIDEEFVRIMENSINGKEMINHTMAHGVIVGPGRSGKNTLMNRLMGSGPPEPDTISPSTGVLENIVKVEVKKLCTVATAVSNLEWKKLKYDEEALELIMTTVRYHSVKTNVPKPITVNSIRFCKQQSQKSLIGVTDSIKSSHPSRVLSPNEITKYKIQERFISSRSISEYEGKEGLCTPADVKPEDIFKRALNLRGMDALRQHLESSWSLYLTNTGGQIEFQEHLPLLVSGPSIFFVTFPLHFDLKECYYVRYVYPDGQVATYKSPTSLLEELLQMLATINTSTFVSDQQRYSETGIKPKIFFVGTYKDFLPAESAEKIIQEKDKLLQKYIRQTSLFDHGSVQFAEPPRQLIFTVNNLSKDNEQFQKIRLAVQKTVEKNIHDFTVECPSSWLVLSLILRAKHKSDQILSFDKCFYIAQECGITDHEELNQALSFIHSRLGLVQYYNIEGLNTQVVVDPQILFDKITDLIVKTFTCDNVEVKEMEDFCQRGIIPEAVMQKLSSKSSSDSQLPFIWLAKLLNYLKIAALFEDKDGIKYFFPSALCHAPEFHFNQPSLSYLWPPLLVGFKCGFCPRGVPGALIKYLMTNEMKSKRRWNIIPNRIFRNQVSFAIEALDIITLRILPTHLEICYDSERDSVHVVSKESNLTKRTCEVACMQIMKGMSTITSQCKECDYFFVGFYCTLDECQTHEHPAELEWDGENPSMLSCKVANRRGNLPKGYDIWNLQKKQRSGKVELNKEIDVDGVPKHLGQVADLMTEWEGLISEELRLLPADVASIRTKYPSNLKLQSREALHLWKQRLGSDATYQKLSDAFEHAGYRSYAEIVRNIASCDAGSEENDYNDNDEPISQPDTYPQLKSSIPSSPKPSSYKFSSFDAYLLINQANVQDLPEEFTMVHTDGFEADNNFQRIESGTDSEGEPEDVHERQLVSNTQPHDEKEQFNQIPDELEKVCTTTECEVKEATLGIRNTEDLVEFTVKERMSRIHCNDQDEQPVFSENPAELEKACMIALETVHEAREVKLGTGNMDTLVEFVMKTFDHLNQSSIEQLNESTNLKSSKKLQLVLSCKVLRGSGLSAKDPKGKCDPYCQIGLLNEAHLDSDIVEQKNLLDWNEARIIGLGPLHATKVRPATLEPEWNEIIEIPVCDMSNEYLVLEVWDRDQKENDASNKGVKGLLTLRHITKKAKKKGDDFIGRLFYPLRFIPVPSGEEKTFFLYSHSGKSQNGTITLQLSIKVVKHSLPVQITVSHYNILAHSLVNSCIKRDGRYLRKWDGQLPLEAEKLLDYHALLNTICAVQRAYTHLLILLSYHKMYQVELWTFCNQIQKIRDAEALPCHHLHTFSPKPELIVYLFDEFENQTSACIEAMMRDSDKKCIRQFRQKINFFHQLYLFTSFTECLPPGSRSCDEVLERCTFVNVSKWFLEQHAVVFTRTGKEACHGGFKSLVHQCADQLERGLHVLHPYFMEVGVNFFSHYYVAFDKLIGAEGESRACSMKDYSVYLYLRRMAKLSQYVNESHIEKGLYLMKSYCWFERCDAVRHWIQAAIEKCKIYIQNAIADDSPVPVTDSVNYSTSAHHTEGFLCQIGNFWKNLDWPEPLTSSFYVVMVVKGIADCTIYYISEMVNRLDCIEEIFDERGNIKVNPKLFIFVNNVNYIHNTLSECSKWLELEPFYDWLEEKQKLGKKCKESVEKIIQEAEKGIQNELSSAILDNIVKTIVPNVQQFLHEMIQERKSVTAKLLSDTELCAPLLDYLTNNLKSFTSSLHPSVASIIPFYLWEASVDSVEKCLCELQQKRGRDIPEPQLYYKLFMALSWLREFFYCDGKGITKKQLDTKKFEELHSRLYILSESTEDLVFHYLSDLAQLQPKDDEVKEKGGARVLGKLHFTVAYLKEKSTVEVNILQQMDLDIDNPYVRASLMPPWIFPKASRKTKVQTNPVIDENVNLPAIEENLNAEDTVLLLAVFDRNVIFEDDFTGMCVVPCKDIPRFANQQVILRLDAPQKKRFMLPLFRPLSTSPIRVELESRAGFNDSKAKQVIKTVLL